MPCRATQHGQAMVKSSDKTLSTGEGNGKPLQYSCLENPMENMKRQIWEKKSIISQSQEDKSCMVWLDLTRVVRLKEIESRMVGNGVII